MKFLVVEKVNIGYGGAGSTDFASEAMADLKYKVNLAKKGKIVGGGPFLDTLGDCYILETKTLEEMGEILFNSPSNFFVEREVHPLGTFEDSLEGMKEMSKAKK
jgi:hypothetical protein